MKTAKRRRTQWAVGGSVIAHLAVIAVLASQRSTLVMPIEQAGPPPAIIPILLVPRTPPPMAGKQAPPTPIRLHRRPQRFIPPEAPVAPIAPPAPPPAVAAPPRPAAVALHPAPQPAGPTGDVRTALRQGAPGCANALSVGLNRAERDLCEEKLGKGAKDAPFYAPGLAMSAGKKALLDQQAADREADYKYKRTQANGRPGGNLGDGTAHGLAEALGSEKPEIKTTIPN